MSYTVRIIRPGDGPFNTSVMEWLEDNIPDSKWKLVSTEWEYIEYQFVDEADVLHFRFGFEFSAWARRHFPGVREEALDMFYV